jgi:DNA polymerase-3 subunit alpha
MQKYLKDLQPETLEDLCFMVSAYRPGPMKYIPEYILCRHDQKEPEYLIPEMEPILNKTYGFAIYQEQVIKIAVDIAGYTMGKADLLRRAMGKKKIKIMKQEEPIFKEGVMKKGYDKKIADKIWEYLLPFADYGFNKAHGASYALVAYWCAYLKANYPIEFMTGLMHSDVGDSDRIAIDMAEARKLGFTILPPDVNKSDLNFTIENRKYIRFGLGAVKHVGHKLVESLVEERQESGDFKDFADFLTRIAKYRPTKKALECLIKIGAFDKFAQRNQLLAIVPHSYELALKREKNREIGQVNIFAAANADGKQDSIEIDYPALPDIDDSEKINWERELIGTFITAHPLDKYSHLTIDPSIFNLSGISDKEHISETDFKANQTYKFLAVIASVKNLLTKNGNKPMAVMQIEDQFSRCDAVVFPKSYEELKSKLVEGQPVLIFGKVSENRDVLNIVVEDIYPADSASGGKEMKIDISKANSEDELVEIKKVISAHGGGSIKLTILYGDTYQRKKINTTIKHSPELITQLNKYLV